MTAQLPLPVPPAPGVPVGSAVFLVEDADGGRVFINGQLCFAWDGGDAAIRRFAAVQLVRIKAARVYEVAAGFGVDEFTVYRWGQAAAEGGPAALVPGKRGPRGPSKLTSAVIAEIAGRRGRGEGVAEIAAAVGVSARSVSVAMAHSRAVPAAEIPDPTADPTDPGAARPAAADPGVAGSTAADPTAAAGPTAVQADGGDAAAAAAVLPVLPDPVDRSVERAAARWGLLPFARPVFAPAARVPLAGLFLALPALTATGLLDCARQVYGGVPDGFYGLDTVLCEAVFRALLGQPRAEGATRVNPADLGRVLGLDRAPEVKTVRRKTALLAARGKAADLLTAQASLHLTPTGGDGAGGDGGVVSVLYIDGHVRTYHGRRKIQKTHSPRLRFPAPATVETWIVDGHGAPVWVVMAEPGASLAAEIRRLCPQIRTIVGDDRRVLVGFDRGGWSPALFADLITAGFDILTWRKGPADDVPVGSFTAHTATDDHGVTHPFTLADHTVHIPLNDQQLSSADPHSADTDTDTGAEVVTLRQVSKLDPDTGRQMHILTSRTDLTPGQVCLRMSARWRQENYFRYGRMHYALDSHDSYTTTDDDPDRTVPNPAKKTTHHAVQTARARLTRAQTTRDERLLALRSPTPGAPVTITNQLHDQITAPTRAAADDLATAIHTHRATPTRLPLSRVRPGQQILDTETKLLTHAIRIAAFNTQTTLARTLTTATEYARAADEAHALIRTALTGTGDIQPIPGGLHIRLDPMHTPRATAAIGELCTALNCTTTVYPGTDLTLHYSVKPHR